MGHEAVILANLFCLLMGFALLSRHFERSNMPEAMPVFLPGGWPGGFALLAIVFVLSAFLDNRRRADWRDDGQARVQGQGAHWLSCRDRGRLERRRLGQRRR
jgi:hypothetical protein